MRSTRFPSRIVATSSTPSARCSSSRERRCESSSMSPATLLPTGSRPNRTGGTNPWRKRRSGRTPGEGRRRPPASQSRVGRRSLRSSPGSHPVGAERHSTMPQLTRIREFSQPGCFGGRAISRPLFHGCPCRPLSLPQLRWPRFRPMMMASQPAERQLAAGDGSLTAGGRRRWAKAVAEAGQ